MRVLQINKFLFQFGGVERYMFALSALLQQRGHDVRFFGMDDPRNVTGDDARFLAPNIDLGPSSVTYRLHTLPRTIGKTLYSFESRRRLRALLSKARPDLAHVHLVSHQISPSILDELKAHEIPIVQTVHEYQLVCPSYHLYLHDKGQICERCLGGDYYHAVLQRCVKGSLAGSALAAAAQYVHRGLAIYDNIDLFVSPSRFMFDKLVAGGVTAEKLRVLKLWIDPDAYEPRFQPGNYIVYFGRLSPEKGVETLLMAMTRLRDVKLIIAGDGPDRTRLDAIARTQRLENVEFTGFLDGQPLHDLVRHSALAVVPSLWYENSPMVVYEANALGKPVIASRIGGLPEDIDQGVTGYLCEPGDATILAQVMGGLIADPSTCERMGRDARARLVSTCGRHYDALMGLYAEASQRRGGDEGLVETRG